MPSEHLPREQVSKRSRGAFGEEVCDQWMRQHGHAVVCRNRRIFGTEFDRVYERENWISFVEVKVMMMGGFGGDHLWRHKATAWVAGAQCRRQQRAINAWAVGGGRWQACQDQVSQSVRHVLLVVLVPRGFLDDLRSKTMDCALLLQPAFHCRLGAVDLTSGRLSCTEFHGLCW